MALEVIRELIQQMAATFDPVWLHSALLLALFSTVAAVGVFAYLNWFEKKNYINFWMVAWVLYAMWLGACILEVNFGATQWLLMVQLACTSLSALCMFEGSLEMLNCGRSKRELALAVPMLLLWSAVAAYQVGKQLWITVPVFLLLAAVGVFTGSQYLALRRKYRGAALLALGFGLWGIHLLGFPFQPLLSPLWLVLGHFTTAVVALFIIFGMMVLVLEQAQERHQILLDEFQQSVNSQKSSEREAALSGQKYQALFRAARDAIFLVDLETLKLLEANDQAKRLVRGTRDGAELPESFLAILPSLGEPSAVTDEVKQRLLETIQPPREFAIRRLGGTEAPCEGSATMIEVNQRPALLISIREISERKKMEQQLQRAEKLSALGQLVAGVAHELNNPLAVITGYAQILTTREHPPTRVRGDLKKILYESERAAKIVRNLLRFARPQELQLSPVDINNLIEMVAENHATAIESGAITLRLRLDPTLPRTMADPHQLEQVLTNIITNAVQALTDHNGPRQLEVRSQREGSLLRITIADSGPGIPPDILPKIFDPFFTTKGPGKGTGLGLTICHSIIQEHHGKILVESEKGKGARFTIELPIVECPQPPTAAAPTETKSEAPRPVPPRHRLLLVDDEPGILEVLGALFQQEGYWVDSATSGQEALSLMEAGRYDVIISDLCMPGLGGEALYERVRALSSDLASRIIFITGDTVSGTSRAFLESTGNRWFGKPFNLDEIQATVREVLAGQHPTAHL